MATSFAQNIYSVICVSSVVPHGIFVGSFVREKGFQVLLGLTSLEAQRNSLSSCMLARDNLEWNSNTQCSLFTFFFFI